MGNKELYTEVDVLGRCGYQGQSMVGIMKTPCFPNEWYGGYINGNRLDGYHPGDNSSGNFFRTQDEAIDNVIKVLEGNPTFD